MRSEWVQYGLSTTWRQEVQVGVTWYTFVPLWLGSTPKPLWNMSTSCHHYNQHYILMEFYTINWHKTVHKFEVGKLLHDFFFLVVSLVGMKVLSKRCFHPIKLNHGLVWSGTICLVLVGWSRFWSWSVLLSYFCPHLIDTLWNTGVLHCNALHAFYKKVYWVCTKQMAAYEKTSLAV